MNNRIITISREFGSGGRTIGRRTAAELGLPCYDAELIEKLEEATILELAGNGPCVIMGRCADYILQETADCLNVFIYSDMEKRAQRIVEQYGVRDDSPEKRLQDRDKRRAAYYQSYTGMKWGVVRNYHIALNSGVLGIDTCVEMIARLYDRKFCES